MKAGPDWKTSRRNKAAWLSANIADKDPSVRSKRGLRRAADQSVGILNWFSNRKSKLGSSDTDSQMGSSRRNRDPPLGSPKWNRAGGIPDGNPPMGTPSPEYRRSLAGENVLKMRAVADKLQVVPRGLEPRTLRLLAVRSNQLSYETNCFGLHWQHQKRRDMKTGHLFIHSQHLDPWHGRRCAFLPWLCGASAAMCSASCFR